MDRLFDLGQLHVSEQAAAAIDGAGASLPDLLARHQGGDWMAEGEAAQWHNAFAARNGLLVASEYALSNGQGVLLVTAQDRANTWVLLPGEYQPVEVGLVEGYARWAARYDAWKNPVIAVETPAAAELLRDLRFSTALDVGVGTGRHAAWLAERGARVVGMDLSPAMLEVARTKQRAGEGRLALVRADGGAPLPFAAASFDLVVCALALCHVAPLRACLAEFARVQAGGGACLISAFHPEAIAFGWRTAIQEADSVYRLPNQAHTRQDYVDGLEAAGYQIRQVLDLRVGDVPAGHFAPEMVAKHGQLGLCLVILAERA